MFNAITEIFSTTKQPTTNIYFSKICEIKLTISQLVTSPNELIHKMAEKMMIKFDKYLIMINDIIRAATILDPRYKMELLQYYYEKLYEHEDFSQVSKIR